MNFVNVYEDTRRVDSYAKLEFPGTYYLAYRDLPEIINEHAAGRNAVDFGCGTGRSTRFLQKYGFNTTGIDISEDMILKAREFDPDGDYRLIEEGSKGNLPESAFDLVLSVFTFDNIPSMETKVSIFRALADLLNNEGRIINLVSSPEIYVNEWASFSTKDFPENRSAVSGDKVKIIMTDVDDRRPVEDIVFSDEDYRKTYEQAGLKIVKTYRPLAVENEQFEWINETKIPPWVIYVLERS
ncbi:MAG: class I SAM-dependent methyltransferase [bacterium]|nr:class I SAM-dependent methyltransferase [bacterium]